MSDYFKILEREIETSLIAKPTKEEKKDDLSPISVPIVKEDVSLREEEPESIKKEDKDPFAFSLKNNQKKTKGKIKIKNITLKQIRKITSINPPIISREILREKESIWITLSEAANMGGVQPKTLRRAIKSNKLKYKIAHNRYLIDFASLMSLLLSNRKLSNKLNEIGIGQFVKEWKKLI